MHNDYHVVCRNARHPFSNLGNGLCWEGGWSRDSGTGIADDKDNDPYCMAALLCEAGQYSVQNAILQNYHCYDGSGCSLCEVRDQFPQSRIFSTDIFRLRKGVIDPSEVRFCIA